MQIKLIIWDLDDTLWQGTLADGEAVTLFEHRAALVRAFNARGVVNAICSKNDFASARQILEQLGLWDEFVFPHIAFTPKAAAIQSIIAAMQLRPANVLFVDDNAHVLQSARALLPELHLLDAASPGADSVLDALLAAQPECARSRIAEYRMLEAKARDRADASGDDEAFLRSCAIQACAPFLMDNLDFVVRIAELVNRSNRLNYTGTRFSVEALTAAIVDVVRYDSWSVFAWDRYGDYGLVGFMMVDRAAQRLIHFAFSCRVMHMGLERYALARARENWPALDVAVLDGRVSLQPADWIADRDFHAREVRERLIGQLRPDAGGSTRDVRIMFDCQSGGIAHFSRHRARIDFDNAPRLFALRSLIEDGADSAPAEPICIYGAGVDYSDPRWPGLADLLEEGGLYEGCVHLLCERMEAQGSRLLVVLPPEDAPEGHYRPHMGHTRARTILFNASWRAAAALYPGLSLLDLTGVATPADMPDVSHYRAGFLQKLAERIDRWIEGESSASLSSVAA